jgi:hypothetical protein
MSEARHNPEAFFEANGGWPDDWNELDELYFREWSARVDRSAPDPQPEDYGEASGSWFEDERPDPAAKDSRPIRPGPKPGPRSAA